MLSYIDKAAIFIVKRLIILLNNRNNICEVMREKSTKLSRGINNDFCINIDDFRSNGNIKHIIISLQYKLTKGKKSITVSWAKIRGIKGYQVRTYKVHKGKNIYPKWSSVTNMKTK